MTTMQLVMYLFGCLSALLTAIALLRLMPPKALKWGRALHIFVASGHFCLAVLYLLLLFGFVFPASYSRLAYPFSLLVLSPGWVIYLTQTMTRRLIGV